MTYTYTIFYVFFYKYTMNLLYNIKIININHSCNLEFLGNKYWTFKLKNTKIEIQNIFKIEYSIIIPAYNEEKRIVNTLKEIDKYLNNKNYTYEIIIVDDWSKDNTIKTIQKLNIKNLEILKNIKNKWKWYSVKKGILKAQWKYILYTDADNSTPIEELDKLNKYIKQYDIIIWSRYLNTSKISIKQSFFRQKIWKIWNLIIKYILIGWIEDTQCWFKLFKHNVAKKVFSMQKINGFGFDMEILLISKLTWLKIKEVPVNWHNSLPSRLRPIKDSFKTLLELIFIKINYWFDWYK